MNLPSESYRPCLRKPHKEGCASASTVASSLSKFCGTRLVLPLSFIPATSGFRAGTELRLCLDQWHPLQNVCCNDSFRAGLSMRMHKKAMRTSMETIEAEKTTSGSRSTSQIARLDTVMIFCNRTKAQEIFASRSCTANYHSRHHAPKAKEGCRGGWERSWSRQAVAIFLSKTGQ